MTIEDITVEQYINARWKGDISIVSKEDLETINEQYADISGLYESEEFNKVAYIHYLNNRINSVKLSIRLQYEFIENFGIPYVPELKFFNKFGHRVTWNNDMEKFLEELRRVDQKEKKYISQLETSMKELITMRENRDKKEQPKKQTRQDFVSTLISLGKVGYTINRKETTIEEVALMIKKQYEEAAEIESRTNKQNRKR